MKYKYVKFSWSSTGMLKHILHWGRLPFDGAVTGRDYQNLATLARHGLVEEKAGGYYPTEKARTACFTDEWGCLTLREVRK